MEYSVDYSDVIKAGILERKGLVLGRWARRFYILRDTFLFICRAEPAALADGIAHPDHVIFLSGAAEMRPIPPTKQHPFAFSLTVVDPAREEHLLAAPSEEERAEWMECIADSIKMHQAETAEAEAAAAAAAAAARASRSASRNASRTASRTASRAGSPSRSATSRLPKPLLRGNSNRNVASSSPPAVAASARVLSQTLPHTAHPALHAASDGDAFTETNGSDSNGWLGTSPALPRQRVIPGAAAAAHAAAGRLDNNVAVPAESAVSLHASSSAAAARRQVAALSLKDESLRLDAFTVRTRSNIMEDALEDDASGGFGPLPEDDDEAGGVHAHHPEQMYDAEEDGESPSNSNGNGGAGGHAFSDAASDRDAYDSGLDAMSPVSRVGGHSRASSSSFSAAASPRSTSSRSGFGVGPVPSLSASPAPSVSVSAVDDDTRLKLAQIEAGNNDPELLVLQRETQLVDDKIAKLRLHKKVLANEIKSLTPKLAIQAKVNRSYGEEIQLYKALASKRAAHRIQVSKWALGVRARLARSEPLAIMKAMRKEQALQLQQQQQQFPNAYSPSFGSFQSSQPSSPAQSFSQTLAAGSSSPGGSGSGNSGTPGKLAHSELIRLSNLELDSVEREVRMRRPAEGPAPDLLTSLQREEASFEEADAHTRAQAVTSLEQLEEWNRQRQRGPGSNGSAPLDHQMQQQQQVQIRQRAPSNAGLGPMPPLTVPSAADSYSLLLRAHTASLNNLTHLVVSVLLREIDIRRQLNLLQDSIFKLTSEKENSFRNAHAILAAAGPVSSKQARAAAKQRNKK